MYARLFAVCLIALVPVATADDAAELPRVFFEDFSEGADNWQPTDPSAWKIQKQDDRHVYALVKARSNYNPPHRSPLNIALRKDTTVGSFSLMVKFKSTCRDYNHRDLCLFFGHQNPGQFYYVHFGKKADPHANQIFIVNEAPRLKISTRTTEGTPWQDDTWHTGRIDRDVETGSIKVYFDDMEKPAMEATDKTFTWGRIGIGSFDDEGEFDTVLLLGETVEPPASE